MPITYAQAIALKRGDELWHLDLKNSDGTPTRCRVTGKVQTWKRDPGVFKIPVTHGLRHSFCIISENDKAALEGRRPLAHLWCLPALWPAEHVLYSR
jgi:hypothetical protein